MKTALAIVALIATLSAGNAAGTTAATLTSSDSIAGNTVSVSCFAQPSYVWEIETEVTQKKGLNNIASVVNIRQDEDKNCLGSLADPVLYRADLTLTLQTTGGSTVATDSGRTNKQGDAYLHFSGIADGTYHVVVTSLTHPDVDWLPPIDVQNPIAVNAP